MGVRNIYKINILGSSTPDKEHSKWCCRVVYGTMNTSAFISISKEICFDTFEGLVVNLLE
jgi:hypothetical protein